MGAHELCLFHRKPQLERATVQFVNEEDSGKVKPDGKGDLKRRGKRTAVLYSTPDLGKNRRERSKREVG